MCRADTANSLTDSYGTSLYSIPEIGYTRDAFRKTVANAQKHGVFDVVPWLALGCGFQRTVKNGNGGFGDGTTTLNFDWNYEYICERATNGIGHCVCSGRPRSSYRCAWLADDWMLGREINDPWPFNSSAHPAGFAAAWSDKFAPWNHATRAVLWPHPFAAISHPDEGGQHPLLEVAQGNTTHMLMHLVSYVLGAAAEQRLPPGQPRVNTA